MTARTTATRPSTRPRDNIDTPIDTAIDIDASLDENWLLEALGQAAVEQGKKVAWFTLEDLAILVRRHRADDTVTKAIDRVLRADLIVIDDIGLLPVASDAAEGLYRLVDAA